MTTGSTFLIGRDIDLNLDLTLGCGQAFRWTRDPSTSLKAGTDGRWVGVLDDKLVRVWQENNCFYTQTSPPADDLALLRRYFQLDASLSEIVKTFPNDPHLRAAVRKYFGLRLLRQDPWETLASFILSSTKRIGHIQQIVAAICKTLGTPIIAGHLPSADESVFPFIPNTPCGVARPTMPELNFTFPSAAAVGESSSKHLRACKAGFRAEYLWETAKIISSGQLKLETLHTLPYADAHQALLQLPGVGPKIADCVLLFGCGKQEAFPMDVWIERALRQLYFRGKRKVTRKRLDEFRKSYFGPFAGYAQQYLFHYVRMNPEVLG